MTFIGNKIRGIRRIKKFSQLELANRTNVHVQYISNIERGVCVASVEFLKKFAKVTRTKYALLVDACVDDFKARF